jgi:hypothetical protein
MKIRAGFVSNSSSTSFLIISKGAFTREQLLRLMGVDAESPMHKLFDQLYDEFIEGVDEKVDLRAVRGNAHWKYVMGRRAERLSDRMIEKLEAYRQKGWTAYYGHLDSESNPVQTFFCMDSFEEENDEIYLNGLECAW